MGNCQEEIAVARRRAGTPKHEIKARTTKYTKYTETDSMVFDFQAFRVFRVFRGSNFCFVHFAVHLVWFVCFAAQLLFRVFHGSGWTRAAENKTESQAA